MSNTHDRSDGHICSECFDNKYAELDDILAAVYLAGVSGGLHRDITDPDEIMHRKEGFLKANPVSGDAKRLITAHTNKQIAEVLDRLKQESIELATVDPIDEIYTSQGYVPESVIEAERQKLKESK